MSQHSQVTRQMINPPLLLNLPQLFASHSPLTRHNPPTFSTPEVTLLQLFPSHLSFYSYNSETFPKSEEATISINHMQHNTDFDEDYPNISLNSKFEFL